MCVQRLKQGIFGAGVVLLTTACNQMDTILPSSGTYQVDAVNGAASLNEYSVIAAGDTIRPYFVNPVVDDPDLRALVIYVEDDRGEVLGRRVLYSPDINPARLALSKGKTPEEETQEKDGETAETAIPDDDVTVFVKNFAGQLPPFPLPEGLKFGAYSLVFEIRGEQTVLNRMNQPFYYIGDREFTVGEIRHYLPGFYENGHLIPPGLRVMLETQVNYGENLDPYVIWYNGKNNIGEGFAGEGAGRLLWAVPLRSGFHTIRAEVFPFKPQAGQKGKIKEFSLPVSQKSEISSGPDTGDCLYWYRFAGDLLDAKTGQGLNPLQMGKSPSWYPVEQVYGLALDEGQGYGVADHFLDLSANSGGRIGFFVRVLPLKNGRIFSARLGSSLTISLSLEGGLLLLNLEEREQKTHISKALPEFERGPAFTGIFITVKLDEPRVSASLALGTPGEMKIFWPEMAEDAEIVENTLIQASEWVELSLSQPLSGTLRSWIGADPEEMEARKESPDSGSSAKSAVSRTVLVLDDFSAIFCASDTMGGGGGGDNTIPVKTVDNGEEPAS
ncbi:MAG: hypothetical protein LBU25_00700 [Treponema sp.]|jgi:hypothetical protein|nr:hypothetical protein [Treponema sp.]